MSVPTFTLVNYGTGNVIGATDDWNSSIKYLLYSDPNGYFEDYYEWVQDSSNNPTTVQQNDADWYSNYVLRLECDLSTVSSNKRLESGCCIRS